MTRALTLVLATLFAASTCTSVPPATIDGIREVRSEAQRAPLGTASESEWRAVVAADAGFALRLYRELVRAEDGNLFFSPFSISTALSMTYAGAREQTAAQLAAALGIPFDAAAWHAGRNAIDLRLIEPRPATHDGTPITLDPTNAIFGQDGYPFREEFLRVLAEYYGAGMQALDFTTDPEAARRLINAWVNDRTRDRIPELLPDDAIDTLTVAVLVNAIYFKASWQSPFGPDSTRDRPFHRLDGSTVSVPLMSGRPETRYAAGDGWQAVSLPYVGGASMLVIVPDGGRFADIEAGFDPDFLANLQGGLAEQTVILDLPRWESASAIDLIPALKALGIDDLFVDDVADLSGIAGTDDLYVTGVVHQANVTVDEEGTEAAAATAVVVGRTSAGPPPINLTVDRPFIYLIRDDITGEILFLGRVLDPSAG